MAAFEPGRIPQGPTTGRGKLMSRCGAIAKSTGERCKRSALQGKSKCGYHGGKSLSGTKHPGFKHGLYSKDPELRERLKSLHEASGEVSDLKEEIALGRAVVSRFVEDGVPVDPEEARTVLHLLDVLGRLVKRHHNIQHGDTVNLTVEGIDALLNQVVLVVRDEIGEDAARRVGGRLKEGGLDGT